MPVTIDNVRVPLGFGESQATSIRGWRGDRSDSRYQTVLTAMGTCLGKSSELGEALSMLILFHDDAGRRGLLVLTTIYGFSFLLKSPFNMGLIAYLIKSRL